MEEWVKAQFVGIFKWGRIKNGMFINCIPLRNLHYKQRKNGVKHEKICGGDDDKEKSLNFQVFTI